MYKKTVTLNHNESVLKVNKETGEIKEIPYINNNLPEGKSLDSLGNFTKLNVSLINRLKDSKLLTTEEVGIVCYMSAIAEFGTNSLKPLSNDSTVRELSSEFGIGINRVTKVFEKLFILGVYMQIRIHSGDLKEYWVLNPNISWKGRIKSDSLFEHFKDCTITRLL